ncbi:hypothetical protein GOV03_04810 [Candidatus Woesearchaeota archaeon]|nr:hypothetical protein [Candidatus Woesearchaeota archaeon]
MAELERIVDVDKELLLSVIPVYGETKLWNITKDFDPGPKWVLRAMFCGAKYAGFLTLAHMSYDIANKLNLI